MIMDIRIAIWERRHEQVQEQRDVSWGKITKEKEQKELLIQPVPLDFKADESDEDDE